MNNIITIILDLYISTSIVFMENDIIHDNSLLHNSVKSMLSCLSVKSIYKSIYLCIELMVYDIGRNRLNSITSENKLITFQH